MNGGDARGTVLEESKRLWELHGENFSELKEGFGAVPRRKVIECFVYERDEMASVVDEVENLTDAWDVTVVVPTHRLGDAHEVFRGLMRVKLQGWWTNANSRVCFGVPEVP